MDGDQRSAAGAGRAGAPLCFRVASLDCPNEVRALRGAVGPLGGGEARLFFDTAKGVMTVAGLASLWGAISADVGASLLVVLNGLRLLGGGKTVAPPPSAPPAPASDGWPALPAQG
ncbi:hypothetical protein QWZ14_29770 [Paeniroseomonas aquatica]|uniref:Uncharacterized protein n=1 Tax=Paeniroseomonas aquatica TaxID=373043 RepID=A0ABT8AGB8_9PROT|nr:hypothetical protein [Paeniroseomonas aquatica]MDN3568586.1 hypothetical protein [Paeniroseomonas aquatica]